MRKSIAIVVILVFVGVIAACSGGDDMDCQCAGSNPMIPDMTALDPPAPSALVDVTADRHPVVGGTATVTMAYEFVRPDFVCDSLTLVAHGSIAGGSSDIWTVVSGDSSFIDTVRCFERREHKVVLQFHRKGEVLIDGLVGAPIDSTLALGGGDTVCLCVK